MVYGIIPARGGSKGVPGKNIRLLGGYPLIAFSIAAARLSKTITRAVVSTDSEEIAAVARRYGAEVPFLRPAELARDTSLDIDFVLHAIQWFRDHEAKVPDHLVHLRPTTPLRDPAVVDRAVVQLCGSAEATSLRSAHLAAESPFKWFRRDAQGYFTGLAPDLTGDQLNICRQSCEAVYIPDGYVDVLRCSMITASGSLHGNRILAFVSPECTEVDSARELAFLEFELQNSCSPVYEYLQSHFPKER